MNILDFYKIGDILIMQANSLKRITFHRQTLRQADKQTFDTLILYCFRRSPQ